MDFRDKSGGAGEGRGPSESPSNADLAEGQVPPRLCWTFELVEERLIEAVTLWRRAPGGGASPFARDAPWGQMRRINEAGDAFSFYDPRGFDMASSDVRLRPLPLVRAEHGRMIEASGWIERFVAEDDRVLVCKVVRIKAGGRRPSWLALLGEMGLVRGADGLRKRYGRAIAAIAAGLERAKVPVVEARI